MKISLTGLRPGMHELHFEERPSQWGLENHPNLTALVQLTVHLEKGEGTIFLRNHIRTVGHFNCDRCLEEFEQELQEEGRVVFTSDTELVTAHDDEIRVCPHDAHEIDVSVEVRDLLLLSLPAKRLCQADCRGLCAVCGVNLNVEACHCAATRIDTRWQPLQKLLNH